LASWEQAWRNGQAQLSKLDVFVIEEAGMVGSRQMARVLSKLHEGGAKVVVIGDAEQLEPIPAGAAFRTIAEHAGYHELASVRARVEAEQVMERFEPRRGDFFKSADFARDSTISARAAEVRRETKRAAKDISSSTVSSEAAHAGIEGRRGLVRENARGR